MNSQLLKQITYVHQQDPEKFYSFLDTWRDRAYEAGSPGEIEVKSEGRDEWYGEWFYCIDREECGVSTPFYGDFCCGCGRKMIKPADTLKP